MDWKEKIRRWCARSERSRGEVLRRIAELGESQTDAQEFLNDLEKSDFINQTRFLSAFTHDHFHLKSWGPLRISAGLRKKGCSFDEIDSALSILTPTLISEKLDEVLLTRLKVYPDENKTNKPRLVRYLQSRGFTIDFIMSAIDHL